MFRVILAICILARISKEEFFDITESNWFLKGEEGVIELDLLINKEEQISGLSFETIYEHEEDPNFYYKSPEKLEEMEIDEKKSINYLFADKITFYNNFDNHIAYSYRYKFN